MPKTTIPTSELPELAEDEILELFRWHFEGWCPVCCEQQINEGEPICCRCQEKANQYHHDTCGCIK